MAVRTIDESDLVNKKVSQLPERPTDPVGDGGAGMTSREMRERFDAYPEVIRTFFNNLVSSIYADPDVEEDALANLMLLAAEDENGQPGSLSATIAALRENVSTLSESLDSLDQTKFAKGDGIDSFTNKTTDPERANTVLGNYSGAFGSRNLIGEKASESMAIGGLIEHYGQNGLSFGYRVEVRANQSITGGYRVVNKASESVQVGERNTLDGTLTEDEDGNPKSNSRYLAQFGRYNEMGIGNRCNIQSGEYGGLGDWCEWNAQIGKSNSMGSSSKSCFQVGESLTQGDNGKWNASFGYGHNLGHHNECVTVFGYANTVDAYITDSLIAGYDNTARNSGGSSSNKKYDIYMLGHENTNRDANDNDHSNVYFLGKGLRPEENDQVLVGAYNGGVSNCWFEVGCGTSSSNRDTAFAVCQSQSNKWIRIGNTSLTESQLQSLLALI